jgi:hypothetical protein
MPLDDRRRSPRASLDLAVEVRGETASFPARLRSLSRMGALIETERPLAIGSPLRLLVRLTTAELELRGQVIRVSATVLGQGHELALMFAPLPPSVLASIDLLVDERAT